MGRPKKIELCVKEVQKLAEYGLTNIEIAEFYGISESTLRRNYDEYLTKGRVNVKMKLRRKQLTVAMKGNVSMLIWLGKNILGQSEKGMENVEVRIIVERKIISIRNPPSPRRSRGLGETGKEKVESRK